MRLHFEPEEEELYAAFGEFRNSNMFVVNTRSEYHPFTIGREEGVSISPYAPERKKRKGIFQSWPQTPDKKEGYHGTALGHIIHRTLYEKTENTITQIYLSGFTSSTEPHTVLVPLGRSWLRAPELKLTNDIQAEVYGYDPVQRAYLIEAKDIEKPGLIQLELDASVDSPVVNPAFLINNWGTADALLELNGSEITRGSSFRTGHYDTLEMDDENEWKDVLVVWIKIHSTKPIQIKLWPEDFVDKEK